MCICCRLWLLNGILLSNSGKSSASWSPLTLLPRLSSRKQAAEPISLTQKCVLTKPVCKEEKKMLFFINYTRSWFLSHSMTCLILKTMNVFLLCRYSTHSVFQNDWNRSILKKIRGSFICEGIRKTNSCRKTTFSIDGKDLCSDNFSCASSVFSVAVWDRPIFWSIFLWCCFFCFTRTGFEWGSNP